MPTMTAHERSQFDQRAGSTAWMYGESLDRCTDWKRDGVALAIPAGRDEKRVRAILGVWGAIAPHITDDLAAWARTFAIPDGVDVANWGASYGDGSIGMGETGSVSMPMLALRGERGPVERAARLVASCLLDALREWRDRDIRPEVTEFLPADEETDSDQTEVVE